MTFSIIMAQGKEIAKLDPITKAILEGVYDKECVLFKLNGLWHIFNRIMQDVKKYWKESVIDTRPIRDKMRFKDGDMVSYLNLSKPIDFERFPFVVRFNADYGHVCPKIRFPIPTNININMMPFILDKEFKNCRLPNYLKDYWAVLISLCIFDDKEIGKVCYLTIDERTVQEKYSQRRPGIHTERPGRLELRDDLIPGTNRGQGNSHVQHFQVYHQWGIGIGAYDKDSFKIEGGIFMASNVANSCRIWDCQIMDDNCIGHLGDIEHLRSLLPESEVMKPNCLYWLTDRTPHESLPLKKRTYRQFFRLVTSEVSLWFEEHSTKNPLGVVPDPKITKIVKGSKFNKGEAYIASDICN